MVNQPGKLTAAQRAPEKQRAGGQFAFPRGEEDENYEQLLDQYGARKFEEGEVMKGTVLKITDTDVVVDIGYKSEGVIPVAQFIDAGGQVTIKVGDVIDVLLEDTEDLDGHIVLSKEKAEKVKVWEEVEKAYNENTIVRGRVIERIKGGLSVDKAWKHRVVAQTGARDRAAAQEGVHARGVERGCRSSRNRKEHNRLRCVHRSGWNRWIASRHGSLLGPGESSIRDVQRRR
jgi:transcriptional accessory protein Tex/SPT6